MASGERQVVSWIDKAELEDVYNELFSKESNLQQHALQRLSAWKSRLPDERDLPHYIVCTMELLNLELQIKDAYGSHLNQQLAYAMALVRFVNLMSEDVERAETRDRLMAQGGQHAFPQFTLDDKRKSLKIIARMLGIPEWQVDLRHAATHYKKLPTMLQLQDAVDNALDYLRDNCWKPQLMSGGASQMLQVDSDFISNLLQEFMQLQFQMLVANGSWGNQSRQKAGRSPVLCSLEELARTRSSELISTLVDDGYLVFSADQLKELGVSVDELVGNTDSLELPAILVQFWQPLLYVLNNLQLTSSLVNCLAQRLSETGGLCDRIISGWLATILRAASSHGKSSNTEFSYIRPCRLTGRRLLEVVLKSPNEFTAPLIKMIFPLCKPRLSPSAEEQLTTLVRTYASSTTLSSEMEEEDESSREFDSMNVAVDGRNDLASLARAEPQSYGCWSVASGDGIDWSVWPIGTYPGQMSTYTLYELPVAVDGIDSGTLLDVSLSYIERENDVDVSCLDTGLNVMEHDATDTETCTVDTRSSDNQYFPSGFIAENDIGVNRLLSLWMNT